MTNRILIVYFSCNGATKKVAEDFARNIRADLYEIQPVDLYVKDDLNWMNPNSRTSIEEKNPDFRPKFVKKNVDIDLYQNILIGFPIWWCKAPNIIHSFLESYNLLGKNIVVFGTSGGSGFGDTIEILQRSLPETGIRESKIYNKNITKRDILMLLKIVYSG
ncbi:MAG: flavodoxin [Lachnospirales bacterium]